MRTIKIVVLGTPGVGKTSLIRRFVDNKFTDRLDGRNRAFSVKTVYVEGRPYSVQLWDSVGPSPPSSFYNDALGAIMVYDITRPATCDHVEDQKKRLDASCELPLGAGPLPVVLVGAKSDDGTMAGRLDASHMRRFVEDHDFVDAFDVSARTGAGVDQAVRELLKVIVESTEQATEALPFRPGEVRRDMEASDYGPCACC